LEDKSKHAEQEWDLKLQKLRSQTDITVQQLQQQLAGQEEEVTHTLHEDYVITHLSFVPFMMSRTLPKETKLSLHLFSPFVVLLWDSL